MNEYFIITVDTEGDNQWNIYKGEDIKTKNANYVPRFQELCECFGFKPTYLVNFEMANNDFLMSYLKNKQENGLCEVGTHLHAWNSPPDYKLDRKYNGNPYITEYPRDVIFKKLSFMTNLLEEKTGVRPVVHRAGRWATDSTIFDILSELGYKVDCSVVSGCDMLKLPGETTPYGFDYRNQPNKPFFVRHGLLEIPMSVKHIRTFAGKSIKNSIKNAICGKDLWFRPALCTVKEMKKHLDERNLIGLDYAEFMIHSSELMPGGSPYFKDTHSIEKEYDVIKEVFEYAVENGFQGVTMSEYANKYLHEK